MNTTKFKLVLERNGDWYRASCPELHAEGFGSTEAEAIQAMGATIRVTLMRAEKAFNQNDLTSFAEVEYAH